MLENQSFVYIVGVGRSGTSLLQSMFAAHEQVSCLPETSFIRRYVATGKLNNLYETNGLEAVIDQLKHDPYFERTGLVAETLITEALNQKIPLDAALYRCVQNAFFTKDKHVLVDKDPRLIEYLPLIRLVANKTHIIHIIRDPRDVLASKKKAGWSKSGHVWKHVFANRVQIKLGRYFGPKLFSDNYHEVIYEELIAEPDRALSALCRDIGLNYSDKMLSFGEAAKKLVSKTEESWKKETFGPLLQNNKGKWKNSLSNNEIRLLELCCNDAMLTGHYAKDTRSIRSSLRDQLWIWSGRILISAATYPYLFYRYFKLRISSW